MHGNERADLRSFRWVPVSQSIERFRLLTVAGGQDRLGGENQEEELARAFRNSALSSARTHVRTIYEKYGAPRISLLPIGAYKPRSLMDRMHMNPDEAVRAHLELHSQRSIGIHFGLIDNAGESFEAPPNDLVEARRAHGVAATDFVAPHYGQVFSVLVRCSPE